MDPVGPSRRQRRREKKDQKRREKSGGPRVVEMGQDGNVRATGGKPQSKKQRRKNKDQKNRKGLFGSRDQQNSTKKPSAQADEASGGMEDEEPPHGKYANAQKRAAHHVTKAGGPKVVDTSAQDSESGATSGNTDEKESNEMLQNKYSNMIDSSTPSSLYQTLGDASQAAQKDAASQEQKANDLRADAASNQGKSGMADVCERMRNEAARADETASNRRGQAGEYASLQNHVQFSHS